MNLDKNMNTNIKANGNIIKEALAIMGIANCNRLLSQLKKQDGKPAKKLKRELAYFTEILKKAKGK